MTTLVTGVGGFVGSHVLERLQRNGENVLPLSRERADLAEPLPPLPPVDTVIHCAAELDDPARMQAVNVDGTARLVDWARSAGVSTFVYISTGGNDLSSMYVRTKREGEEIALGADGAMNVQIVRLFFAYGPAQRSSRLVPRLIANIIAGEAIAIDEHGGPRMSFTYIDDVVEGILRISRVAGSNVVDLGGPPATIRELAECIGRATSRTPRFQSRSGPSRDLVASTAALRELTGFEPSFPLDDGIRACVREGGPC